MNEDRASRYHRLSRRATGLWLLTLAGALLLLLPAGGSHRLRDLVIAWTGAGPSAPSTTALYALALVLAYQVLRLPVAFYQGFLLDRRFGLSASAVSTWLTDYLKMALLTVALAIAVVEVVYFTMQEWPNWWWAASALCSSAALVILARLAPIALLPLFYRCEPLARAELQERLRQLSQRVGMPILGTYVWGLGEKTRRANAALVGSGATRRILLSDTLLADYSDDEIEVVLAHELAHHINGDVRSALLLESVVLLAIFGCGAAALSFLWPVLGLAGASDVAGLPLLFLVGALVSAAAAPIQNALSRRNERRADRFAVAVTGRSQAFVSAMRRLGAQNLAEERPSRAALWWFHSHPPVEERIAEVRRYLTSR